MRRLRFGLLLLVVMLLAPLLAPGAARAHGAAMQAAITMDPTVPQVNQDVKITVQLVDAFGADVYGVPVRAGVDKPAPLAEASQGTFQGTLRFTTGGKRFVRLEVTLPDGVYLADLPVQVGETVVSGLVVDVVHQDSFTGGGTVAPAPAPPAPATPVAQVPPAAGKTPAPQTPAPQTPAAGAQSPASPAQPAVPEPSAATPATPAGASVPAVQPTATPPAAPVTVGGSTSAAPGPAVAPAADAGGAGTGWLRPVGLGGVAVVVVGGWLLARRKRGRQENM